MRDEQAQYQRQNRGCMSCITVASKARPVLMHRDSVGSIANDRAAAANRGSSWIGKLAAARQRGSTAQAARMTDIAAYTAGGMRRRECGEDEARPPSPQAQAQWQARRKPEARQARPA